MKLYIRQTNALWHEMKYCEQIRNYNYRTLTCSPLLRKLTVSAVKARNTLSLSLSTILMFPPLPPTAPSLVYNFNNLGFQLSVSVCLSVCLSICLSVSVCLCLSVSLLEFGKFKFRPRPTPLSLFASLCLVFCPFEKFFFLSFFLSFPLTCLTVLYNSVNILVLLPWGGDSSVVRAPDS